MLHKGTGILTAQAATHSYPTPRDYKQQASTLVTKEIRYLCIKCSCTVTCKPHHQNVCPQWFQTLCGLRSTAATWYEAKFATGATLPTQLGHSRPQGANRATNRDNGKMGAAFQCRPHSRLKSHALQPKIIWSTQRRVHDHISIFYMRSNYSSRAG